MSQKSRTPDEKLLLQLYKLAMGKGDPHEIIHLIDVMHLLGQKETAVKNIVKHLAQANFIKKLDQDAIMLTEHGCSFVLDLLNE